MKYTNTAVAAVADKLITRMGDLPSKAQILKAPELRKLYGDLTSLPPDQRAAFGKDVNLLKTELERLAREAPAQEHDSLPPIDVTAPFDINVPHSQRPQLLPAEDGGTHPLMTERDKIVEIFYNMGFTASDSREIDDDFHMFGALNFPEGHPARDDYDTFMTVETDGQGKRLIAPAHTSTMQHRILRQHRKALLNGQPIAVVIPDQVFRNEDVDATHDHAFFQIEGIYVSTNVNTGNLMATLGTFLKAYYEQDLDFKTQPFYFPFTEPSFELALSCPFCKKKGCPTCGMTGWIELLGCGMIHPNVLAMADIDPSIYTGFAWGCGMDRLVMMKYGIEDVRHFHSAKLDFLRQFS